MLFLLNYRLNIVSTEDTELRRTLQSLACGKARVLHKIPKVFVHFDIFFKKIFNTMLIVEISYKINLVQSLNYRCMPKWMEELVWLSLCWYFTVSLRS